jgi:hypothetical protein
MSQFRHVRFDTWPRIFWVTRLRDFTGKFQNKNSDCTVLLFTKENYGDGKIVKLCSLVRHLFCCNLCFFQFKVHGELHDGNKRYSLFH